MPQSTSAEAPAPVSDPGEIDVAWLEAALASSDVGARPPIRGFSAEMVGTGQMGRSVRLRLEYEPGHATTALESVVVKLPSDDPTSRATGATQGSYLREVRFYQELARDTPMRTPRCHYAVIDAAAMRQVVPKATS